MTEKPSDKPEIVIKWNNCATNDPCAMCGTRTNPYVGPELFYDETYRLVCWNCGRKINPELIATLEAVHSCDGAMPEIQRRLDKAAESRVHMMRMYGEPTKESLLQKYSRKEPVEFIQFDAWVNPRTDSIIRPDKDGDWICWGNIFELMVGPSEERGGGVRVLIPPKTMAKDAVRVLRKIEEVRARANIAWMKFLRITLERIVHTSQTQR